jgi:hypothetical protein
VGGGRSFGEGEKQTRAGEEFVRSSARYFIVFHSDIELGKECERRRIKYAPISVMNNKFNKFQT